jgi:hypothetical protein
MWWGGGVPPLYLRLCRRRRSTFGRASPAHPEGKAALVVRPAVWWVAEVVPIMMSTPLASSACLPIRPLQVRPRGRSAPSSRSRTSCILGVVVFARWFGMVLTKTGDPAHGVRMSWTKSGL